MRRVVLASASPRRKELLGLLALLFDVVESGFDESRVAKEDASDYVQELALQKALVVSRGMDEGVLIGADTVVELDGEVIGKPTSEHDAKAILLKLAGRKHRVLTGVSVVDALSGEQEVLFEESFVTFRDIGEPEAAVYAHSGVWQGFAGGYAVQLEASKLVRGVEGSYTNVLGLPLLLVSDMLERFGVPVDVDVPDVIEKATGYRS